MTFSETILKGAFVITPTINEDHRGFFARTFCREELEALGLNGHVEQCNLSYNKRRGTFRGMHFQASPFEEEKIVTCMRGACLDYIVDLRESSPTFRQWVSVELTEDNRCSLYVPKFFAHGFFTLIDDTVLHYQMSESYRPDHARGLRFNDPSVDIQLPFDITTISEKDRQFPDLCADVVRDGDRGSGVGRSV
jgi:dTDP-4-dehydrorhamnose 3,5-epimerase